ncbi:hypothetical protein M5K25_019560 [Dendrobium thyrsiflorum]|uniref:Major facilitator superfamily (MFS) profile domain-containing protein n=1 Tax=Dendrobium thyrsiflorum TaxID=117978 RepID=A0ABD0UFX7_DENTH
MASIMERADENLLPAVYKEVSQAFHAGPTDLGYLTFIRNFVQALSSPLAGVLALHYDRPSVLALGTAFWALSTAAVGVSQHFQQVAFWRALNGFGLAIVIPALQSFIADSYIDGSRGTGFGMLNFVGSVGGIGGGVVATIMAGQHYWGIPGWRLAFIMMATLSLMIGVLVFLFVVDPRKASGIAVGTYEDSERHKENESFMDYIARFIFAIYEFFGRSLVRFFQRSTTSVEVADCSVEQFYDLQSDLEPEEAAAAAIVEPHSRDQTNTFVLPGVPKGLPLAVTLSRAFAMKKCEQGSIGLSSYCL